MDKSTLRKKTITYLKSLAPDEKRAIENKLLYNLVHSSIWQQSKSIGVTISQGFEWDTTVIIEAAWQAEKKISVPKCKPSEKKLTFYQLHTFDQLEVVYFNLKEPNPDTSQVTDKTKIDLLIVPGLLFDNEGYRIGFGGGYYDRFLENFSGKTVSLVSKEQVTETLPREPFDIPVQTIITEDGLLK